MNVKAIIRESTIGRLIWPFLKARQQDIFTLQRKKEIQKMIHIASKSKKHIFYCGVCESSNMGDLAQTYCTLNWLKKNYPDYQVLICKTSVFRDPKCNLIGAMKKCVGKEDLIFFQSGYNTHDLGDRREDLMHQKVIQAFPDVEMIMLPQTIYFQKKENQEQCAKIYNAHRKMLLFARDPISEKYAQKMFPDLTVILYPDIVTSLIGSFELSAKRKGIYLCRRKDVEQFYKEEDYVRFVKILQSIDVNVTVSDTIISASNK